MSPDPYWTDGQITLHVGDCVEVLAAMEAASVDAIVTDPPSGAGFMGREWDSDRGGRDKWVAWLTECMEAAVRCLKPGGHALVWSLPRTSHWTAWALEDAGLEIRECIPHLFGSGYPKSLNVAKAIASGGGRPEDIRRLAMGEDYVPSGRGRVNYDHGCGSAMNGADGAVELSGDAARWEGWHTALKPGQEIWWLARKPFKGNVASNVLQYGTGALNIGGCSGVDGRWPTNIMLTHSTACGEDGDCAPDCPVGELDRQSGVRQSGDAPRVRNPDVFRDCYGAFAGQRECPPGRAVNSGGASRFYPAFRYQAKAPASERPRLADGTTHNTVKSLDLTCWQVRLITPPGGTVLDFYAGSGPTAEACIIEGFRCTLIEQDPVSAELIRTRLRKDIQPGLFGSSEAS